jgi:hypothetical protein
MIVQHRRKREDVAHVVVNDERLLAFEHAAIAMQVLDRLALGIGEVAQRAVQREVHRVDEPLERARLAKREHAVAAPPARQSVAAGRAVDDDRQLSRQCTLLCDLDQIGRLQV